MNGIMGSMCQSQSLDCAIRPATLRESLVSKKQRLQSQLADVDEALSALEANPETERIINLLAKTNY